MPQLSTANGFDINEVWYVVIGAGIGFIASIGTIAIERLLDRRGRIKLYYKVIGDRDATFPNGFHYTQNGDMSFSLPMQIEIQNTSKVTRVIRDINIDLSRMIRLCCAIMIPVAAHSCSSEMSSGCDGALVNTIAAHSAFSFPFANSLNIDIFLSIGNA